MFSKHLAPSDRPASFDNPCHRLVHFSCVNNGEQLEVVKITEGQNTDFPPWLL